jgi:hypothetical protein
MNKAFLALIWAVALAALVSVAAAQEVQDDAATKSATVQAESPADASASRVESIRINDYFYQSWGRPDLFSALVSGEFEPGEAADLVDVNNAKLVGVMWGPTDRFALVEDGSGNGYILRVGDRVSNGRVVAVQKKSLVASVSLYGITNRVILRLADGKDER